jgi:hypothetical protein
MATLFNCHNLGHLAVDCKMTRVAIVKGSMVNVIHGHVSLSKKTVVTQRGRDEGHTASTSSGSEKTDSPKGKDDGRKASTGPNP